MGLGSTTFVNVYRAHGKAYSHYLWAKLDFVRHLSTHQFMYMHQKAGISTEECVDLISEICPVAYAM